MDLIIILLLMFVATFVGAMVGLMVSGEPSVVATCIITSYALGTMLGYAVLALIRPAPFRRRSAERSRPKPANVDPAKKPFAARLAQFSQGREQDVTQLHSLPSGMRLWKAIGLTFKRKPPKSASAIGRVLMRIRSILRGTNC